MAFFLLTRGCSVAMIAHSDLLSRVCATRDNPFLFYSMCRLLVCFVEKPGELLLRACFFSILFKCWHDVRDFLSVADVSTWLRLFI